MHTRSLVHRLGNEMSQIVPLELATLKETIKNKDNDDIIQQAILTTIEKVSQNTRKRKLEREDTHITVCDIEFPKILVPTCDHSLDPERVKTYLTLLDREDRNHADVILRNTTYVDFITFIKWLQIALDNLVYFLDQRQPWAISFDELESSWVWVTILSMCIKPELKQTHSNILYSKKLYDSKYNLSDYRSIVIFDDASYSGSQIANMVSSIVTRLPTNYFMTIHIVVTAISISAMTTIYCEFMRDKLQIYMNKTDKQVIFNEIRKVFITEKQQHMAKRSDLLYFLTKLALTCQSPEKIENCKYLYTEANLRRIRIHFHYGHVMEPLQEQLEHLECINESQEQQRQLDIHTTKEIVLSMKNKHTYYFQHKVPDNVSSYTWIYNGQYSEFHNGSSDEDEEDEDEEDEKKETKKGEIK